MIINNLKLNKTNLSITNNGFFKPVFFKFCWQQNKIFIIIFTVLFLLLAFIIPVAAYLSCLYTKVDINTARQVYLIIYSLLFPTASLLYLMLLFILYGKFITNLIDRGDLAYILCSRTSRNQVWWTFLIQFWIIFLTILIILGISPMLILGFKEQNVITYASNPNFDYLYFDSKDPDTWTYIKTYSVDNFIVFYFANWLQQAVIGFVFISIAAFFSSYCNKLNKYFVWCGGVYILFYLFNILQQFSVINESVKWMENFKYFTILTIVGKDFFTVPAIMRINRSVFFPITEEHLTTTVGQFNIEWIPVAIFDSLFIAAGIIILYFARKIFIKKDLPI